MIALHKDILGLAAVGLTLIAFFPYIRSILSGRTKPHAFSWIIWGSATFIVFLAQYADKGGAGAWSTAVSGILTLWVAWLAYNRKSDTTITRMDWVFFLLAMGALPLWYITSDPLWAVVILTTVDTLGFFPTFRKAYSKPLEEQMLFYVVLTLRNFIALAALEHYSLTTILFPTVVAITCIAFIIMVMSRRRALVGTA